MFRVTADLVNAFSYTIKFQHAIKFDQDSLRDKLVKNWTDKTIAEDTTPDSALTSIEAAIDIDVAIAESDNKAIEAFGKASIPSFPLRFNKAFEIATGVKNLFETGDISRLLAGEIVEGYSNIPVLPNIYANPELFYGTSKSTIYSAALISPLMILTQGSPEPFTPGSLKDSNIFHFTPMPAELSLASRYCYRDEEGSANFGFSHSGYTFGGDRVQSNIYTSYALENKFFPDDCSSWVANLTGSFSQYTTRDQKYFSGLEALPEGYKNDVAKAEIERLYEVVSSESAMAGDIVVFNAHTGFLLGKDATTVTILSDNRDMPGIEGFCIQNRPAGDAVKGYLRSKGSRVTDTKLADLIGENIDDYDSLWTLIETRLFPAALSAGAGESEEGYDGAAAALGATELTFADVE